MMTDMPPNERELCARKERYKSSGFDCLIDKSCERDHVKRVYSLSEMFNGKLNCFTKNKTRPRRMRGITFT